MGTVSYCMCVYRGPLASAAEEAANCVCFSTSPGCWESSGSEPSTRGTSLSLSKNRSLTQQVRDMFALLRLWGPSSKMIFFSCLSWFSSLLPLGLRQDVVTQLGYLMINGLSYAENIFGNTCLLFLWELFGEIETTLMFVSYIWRKSQATNCLA